jgi:hypothetical protein
MDRINVNDMTHVCTDIYYQNTYNIYFRIIVKGEDGRLWTYITSCHRLDLQPHIESSVKVE